MDNDLDVVRRFAGVSNYAERETLYALLPDDVEWTTPRRTLRGLSEIREKLNWNTDPHENLEVEWKPGEFVQLGDGRVVLETLVTERWRETGGVAAVMRVREEWQLRDGKVMRYERRSRPNTAA